MAYTTTLRLDDAVGWQLDVVARADGRSINDVVRVAVINHINQRQQDPDFQRKLHEMVGRMRSMIDGPSAIEQASQGDADEVDES